MEMNIVERFLSQVKMLETEKNEKCCRQLINAFDIRTPALLFHASFYQEAVYKLDQIITH